MRQLRWLWVVFGTMVLCGCALLMPPKYEPVKEEPDRPLSRDERAMVKPWQHVLDRKEDYEAFEAELRQLQKKEKHRELVDRLTLYFQTYPVSRLGLFDVNARLRYATLVLIYADSALREGQIEDAGRLLQHARSVVPLNPQIRLKTRELVRIYRRDLLFGGLHPYFDKLPEVNTQFVALMHAARAGDCVVEPTHKLFGTNMVRLGMWEAKSFATRYGSALFLSEPLDPGRIPVVLVHGVNGSPRDFIGMMARFRGTRYQPVYYFYPTGQHLV